MFFFIQDTRIGLITNLQQCFAKQWTTNRKEKPVQICNIKLFGAMLEEWIVVSLHVSGNKGKDLSWHTGITESHPSFFLFTCIHEGWESWRKTSKWSVTSVWVVDHLRKNWQDTLENSWDKCKDWPLCNRILDLLLLYLAEINIGRISCETNCLLKWCFANFHKQTADLSKLTSAKLTKNCPLRQS